MDNNISTNNAYSRNGSRNGKNKYQNSSVSLPTNEYSSNAQNGDENNNNCDSENDKCWLCLMSNCDEDNPLICLCNCHNFIHFECLKKYMNSKIIVTENSKGIVTTYTCSKFNCDICLKPYQIRFRIPEFNRTYELIDLNLPKETDYFCLESLDYIKDNNNNKIVHIVQLIDKILLIGRANYNDLYQEIILY